MNIKILCKEANKVLYEKMLSAGGFTVSDNADLTFIEDGYTPEYILGRDNDYNVLIYLKDIVIIESYGRDIVARTQKGTYKLKETLEKIENLLRPVGFVRISQSAIIQKSMIEKISSGFSRFYLLLKFGHKTVVTRSYYNFFKEFIGL